MGVIWVCGYSFLVYGRDTLMIAQIVIHDYDVYKDGEEEQGFTAESANRAIEIINEIEQDD